MQFANLKKCIPCIKIQKKTNIFLYCKSVGTLHSDRFYHIFSYYFLVNRQLYFFVIDDTLLSYPDSSHNTPASFLHLVHILPEYRINQTAHVSNLYNDHQFY